jgi:tetratricopeptide (TPR) repeat protein
VKLRLGAIVAFAVLAYFNAPAGSFHFDDAHAVVENPSIRSAANIPRFFVDPGTFSVLPQNQGYRPLLLVTYALTAALTGVNSHAFIAVNLLVHILCALLVYAVMLRILRHLGRSDSVEDVAWLTALIFATHPLFSECVNYVSARSESLSAAFTLASLYCYLRAREGRKWIALSALAIAGGLLTKPVVTIFPLILIAFEAAAAERQSLRQIAPRFAVVTAVVLVFGILSGRMTPAFAIQSASSFSRGLYFRSELPAIWHYVRLFVLPMGQNADADYPLALSWNEPRVIAAAVGLAAALAFAMWGLVTRRFTAAALSVAWFILCIFPSSSIFPLAEIVNEHRPYLAAASLCALVAALLVDGVPRLLRLEGKAAREALISVTVLLLLFLSTLTVLRNRVWHDETTLWTDVVEKAPGSTRAQMNLGLSLMSTGRMAEAEPHLREAVRLGPYYSYAHVNLGNMLLAQGKVAEALPHLDRAIQLDPKLFWAHYFRGLAGEKVNEPPAQRALHFQEATRISPNYADAWYHLSMACDAMGDLDRSLPAAHRAVALRSSYEDRFMLAYLLLKAGDARQAKALLDQLHAEKPDDKRVSFNLEYAAKLGAK